MSYVASEQKSERRLKTLAVGAVVLLQAAIAVPVMFRSLPITHGWYLAVASESRSRTLYRDFFWPFPLGGVIFEGMLPNLFRSQFMAHDLIHLVYWLLMSGYLVALGLRISTPMIAILSSSTALTVYFTAPGNIIAGYYETMFLFLTAGIFHLTSIKSPRYDLHLFLGGLFIGLSTTVKQTTGLFAIGVIAVAIYQFRNRRLRGRSTLLCIVGLSLPWAAILVWALSQRTLGEMLRMIFQNDSKGGTWATFTLLLQTVTYWRFSIPATLLTVALLYSAATTNESNDSTRKSARYLSSAISLLYLVSLSTTTFDGVERASLIEGVALSITILGVLILGLHSSQVEHREHRLISAHAELYRVILFALFCLVVVWVSTTVDPTFIYNFPTRISVGPSLADFARLLSSKFLVLGVIGTLAGLLRNSFQHLTDLQRATTLSLGIATVCLQVMNSFAGTPTTETMIFGVLLGLIYVFDRVLDLVGQRFLVCIGLLVSLWTASFVVAQSQNPYSWIGISRPSLALTDKELTVRSEHFLVSDEDALFLLKLNSAVELARKSDSEVFFSARNVGLSELLDLQRYPSRCVVLWWDVCPESESQKDLIQLRKNPPRYALISIEPDEIVEDNELVWRFGEDSSLRSIQEFFTTRVKTGEYKVLFRMAPSSSPDIKTLFLKRMN